VSIIGKVESLWRYPVKSMRGEELPEIFAGYAGVYGDRLFAFESSANHRGFPFFTGRDQRQIVRYRPRFRYPEKAVRPANWDDAEKLAPGVLTPITASPADLMIDVDTPDGKTFAIDDPKLIDHLRANSDAKHELTLLRSDKALIDCRPISIFGVQTAKQLGQETGIEVDQRRFRANIYVDLNSGGFGEDVLVGKSLRFGSEVTVQVTSRDGRCMMITLDPDTAEKEPALLKKVAQAHEGMAGVYGAVLVEGIIRKGDSVDVLG